MATKRCEEAVRPLSAGDAAALRCRSGGAQVDGHSGVLQYEAQPPFKPGVRHLAEVVRRQQQRCLYFPGLTLQEGSECCAAIPSPLFCLILRLQHHYFF